MDEHRVVLAIEATNPALPHDEHRIVSRCACGWMTPLGDPVTAARAWSAEQGHLSEAAMADRIPAAGITVTVCWKCHGEGGWYVQSGDDDYDFEPCPDCGGTGDVPAH